jgi:hypothetical protein
MAIEVWIENNEAGPRVVCDVCASPIDGRGNALWHVGTPDRQYFTHKRCHNTFRHTHEAEHGHTAWMPLEVFLSGVSATLNR